MVYEDIPRPVPWTPGLDWQAWKVRQSDMRFFQQVLIHGDDSVHAIFLADERLVPVTGVDRWRLYAVRPAD